MEADRSCTIKVSGSPLHVTSSTVTSSDAEHSVCGSPGRPWKVEAPVGQQISVTLNDFSTAALNRQQQKEHQVHVDHGRSNDETKVLQLCKLNRVTMLFSTAMLLIVTRTSRYVRLASGRLSFINQWKTICRLCSIISWILKGAFCFAWKVVIFET